MATEKFFDAEAFQRRIEKLSDFELIRQGKTAAEFAEQGLRDSRPIRALTQLKMCRAEWRKRHPKIGSC